MDLFKKIINEYVEGGGKHIGLSCSQSDLFMDPLLLERFEFLNFIKKHYDLEIHNFNTLVLADKYSDDDLKLILSNIDKLYISILGTNREDYFKISGVDYFYKFMNNIERIDKIILDNHLNTKVRLSFRANSLKFLKFDPVYQNLSNRFKVMSVGESYHDWNGKINLSDLPKTGKFLKKDNSSSKIDCIFANAINIQPNGDIIGCNCIDWCSEYILGNAREKNIYEIYKSSVAKEFRHGFSLGKIPDMCLKCAIYAPVTLADKVKETFS